jgi:hypothetical protein
VPAPENRHQSPNALAARARSLKPVRSCTGYPGPGSGILEFGLAMLALDAVSPSLSMVDETKFEHHVDKVQSLDITTVACCHSPVIEGAFIDQAFACVRELPSLAPLALPDQSVLDPMVAATSQPPI